MAATGCSARGDPPPGAAGPVRDRRRRDAADQRARGRSRHRAAGAPGARRRGRGPAGLLARTARDAPGGDRARADRRRGVRRHAGRRSPPATTPPASLHVLDRRPAPVDGGARRGRGGDGRRAGGRLVRRRRAGWSPTSTRRSRGRPGSSTTRPEVADLRAADHRAGQAPDHRADAVRDVDVLRRLAAALPAELTAQISNPTYLEITRRGVDKASAVARWCARAGHRARRDDRDRRRPQRPGPVRLRRHERRAGQRPPGGRGRGDLVDPEQRRRRRRLGPVGAPDARLRVLQPSPRRAVSPRPPPATAPRRGRPRGRSSGRPSGPSPSGTTRRRARSPA